MIRRCQNQVLVKASIKGQSCTTGDDAHSKIMHVAICKQEKPTDLVERVPLARLYAINMLHQWSFSSSRPNPS